MPIALDEIRFSSLKEDRDWYFVEYSPPIENYRFGFLQLSIVEARDKETVALAMESEAKVWLNRYPVPVMVTAFGLDGIVLQINDVRAINHLMAWIVSADLPPLLKWELVANEDLPEIALNRELLREIFATFPFKSGREIQKEMAKQIATRRVGWWLVLVWAVIVPLIVTVVEWSSDLLGLLVLVFAFVKAAIKALRLTGHLPKSKRDEEKEAEQSRMRHHHYHCQRNPEAFERLKAENFKREEIERTKAEALSLKQQAASAQSDG